MTKSLLAAVALLALLAPARAGDAAIGDSLALGTGAALHIATFARVGASSCAILGFAPRASFGRVVLSAGVNDAPGRCIEALRAKVSARAVIWILPPPVNSARDHIAAVALAHGDRMVSYTPGPDRLHPRSYAVLAATIAAAWGTR